MNSKIVSKEREKAISELSSELGPVVCLADIEACEAWVAAASRAVAPLQEALAGARRQIAMVKVCALIKKTKRLDRLRISVFLPTILLPNNETGVDVFSMWAHAKAMGGGHAHGERVSSGVS